MTRPVDSPLTQRKSKLESSVLQQVVLQDVREDASEAVIVSQDDGW